MSLCQSYLFPPLCHVSCVLFRSDLNVTSRGGGGRVGEPGAGQTQGECHVSHCVTLCHTNMSQCPTFSCVCARAELRAAVPAVHAGGAALPADPALPPRPGRPRPPEALPTLGQGDSPARVCPPPAQAAVQIRPRQPGKFYDLNLKMKI